MECVLIILILFALVDSAFTLGRYTASRKVERLEKENRAMRDLLKKMMCMEELTSQTYNKIVHEFTSAAAQKK